MLGVGQPQRDQVDAGTSLESLLAESRAGAIRARDLTLIGQCSWYVIDDRPPLISGLSEKEVSPDTPEYAAFLKRQSEVVRVARENGVRPMLLSRLLSYLGYDFAAPIRGRVEAIDAASMRNLLRGRQGAAPGQPAATPAAPAGAGVP